MQDKPFEAMNHQSIEGKFNQCFSDGNEAKEAKEVVNLLAGLTGSEGQGIEWKVLAAGLPRQDLKQAGESKLSSNPSFNKNDFIFFLKAQALIDWHCYGIQTILKEEKEEKEEKLTYRLYRQGSRQNGHGLGDDNYLHLNAIMRLHHLICALEYFKSHWEVSSQENNNNSPSQPLNNVVSDSQKINFREQLKSFIVKDSKALSEEKDSKALSEEKFNQALHEDLKQFCENHNIAFEEEVGKSPMLNILKILGTVLYPKPEVITKINDEFFHRLIPVTKKTEDQKTNQDQDQDQDQGQETKIDNYINSLSKTSFIYAALTAFKSLIENDAHALGAQARKILPETAKNAWLVELISKAETTKYIRHGALACATVRSSDKDEAERNLAQIKQYDEKLYGINLNTRVGPVWNKVDSISSFNEGQNTMVDETKSAFGDDFINIGQNFFAAWIGYYFLIPKNNDSCGRIFDLFSYLFFILRIIYFLFGFVLLMSSYIPSSTIETVMKSIVIVALLDAVIYFLSDNKSCLAKKCDVVSRFFSRALIIYIPVFIGLLMSRYIQSDLSSSNIETIETILLSVFCCDAGFNLIHALMARKYLRRRLGEIVKQELESLDQKLVSPDQEFVSLDQELESLDQKLVSPDQEFVSLDQELESLDQKLESLFQKLVSPDQELVSRYKEFYRRYQELVSLFQKTIAISCASGQDRTGGAALLFELEKLLELIKSLGIAQEQAQEQAQAQAQAHKMLASASALIANFSSPGAHGVKKQSDLGILPRTVRDFLYNKKPSSKNKDPEIPANCCKKFFANKLACFHFFVCLFEISFFSIRYLDDAHSHDYFEILNKISDDLALFKSTVFLLIHALMSKFAFQYQSKFLGVSFFLTFVFYVYFLVIKGGEQVEEILPIAATLLCRNFEMDHDDVMAAPCEFKSDNPSREQEVSDSVIILNQTSFGLDDVVWDPAANQFSGRCTEFNQFAFTLLWLALSGQDMSLDNPAVNITGLCPRSPWPVAGEVVCEDFVQPSGLLPCDVMVNATDPEEVQGFENAVVSHGGIGSGAPMVWSNEYFAFWVMCSPSQDFYWLQSFVSSDPHYLLNTTEVLVEGQCPQQDWSALTF